MESRQRTVDAEQFGWELFYRGRDEMRRFRPARFAAKPPAHALQGEEIPTILVGRRFSRCPGVMPGIYMTACFRVIHEVVDSFKKATAIEWRKVSRLDVGGRTFLAPPADGTSHGPQLDTSGGAFTFPFLAGCLHGDRSVYMAPEQGEDAPVLDETPNEWGTFEGDPIAEFHRANRKSAWPTRTSTPAEDIAALNRALDGARKRSHAEEFNEIYASLRHEAGGYSELTPDGVVALRRSDGSLIGCMNLETYDALVARGVAIGASLPRPR